ncbi:hypothetical protein QCN27_09150 [Cereibacter sp. SYSU M97828]|nr:hypothetical protein [Cereibacter flavus]
MASIDIYSSGSRICGKISDNIIWLGISLSGGLLFSLDFAPDRAAGTLAQAAAARGGRIRPR